MMAYNISFAVRKHIFQVRQSFRQYITGTVPLVRTGIFLFAGTRDYRQSIPVLRAYDKSSSSDRKSVV